MIEETARVVAVAADAVWIEARRESACGRCALRSGCGHGLLDSARRAPVIQLRLPRGANDRTLRVGERVVLGISEHAVLAGSLRMYALPLTGLLLGTLVGDAVRGALDGAAVAAAAAGEIIAVFGGILGLLLGLLAVFVLDRRRPMEMPRVLRVLDDRPGAASGSGPGSGVVSAGADRIPVTIARP